MLLRLNAVLHCRIFIERDLRNLKLKKKIPVCEIDMCEIDILVESVHHRYFPWFGTHGGWNTMEKMLLVDDFEM